MGKECVVLEDGVDRAIVGGLGVEARAVHANFAGGGLLEAGDQAEQRGFAGAGFAEESEEFAGGDVEAQAFQDFVGSETFCYGVDFEERGAACVGGFELLRRGGEVAHCAFLTSFQISVYLARRGTSCQK